MASSILEENSLFLQILQRIVDANAALNRTVASTDARRCFLNLLLIHILQSKCHKLPYNLFAYVS